MQLFNYHRSLKTAVKSKNETITRLTEELKRDIERKEHLERQTEVGIDLRKILTAFI